MKERLWWEQLAEGRTRRSFEWSTSANLKPTAISNNKHSQRSYNCSYWSCHLWHLFAGNTLPCRPHSYIRAFSGARGRYSARKGASKTSPPLGCHLPFSTSTPTKVQLIGPVPPTLPPDNNKIKSNPLKLRKILRLSWCHSGQQMDERKLSFIASALVAQRTSFRGKIAHQLHLFHSISLPAQSWRDCLAPPAAGLWARNIVR